MNRRIFFHNMLDALALLPATAVARPATRLDANLVLLTSELAGFQYYAGEKLWSKISSGDALELLRGSGNTYDKQAVALFWGGYKIGYIPRIDSAVISQLMDRDIPLENRIIEKNESNDP